MLSVRATCTTSAEGNAANFRTYGRLVDAVTVMVRPGSWARPITRTPERPWGWSEPWRYAVLAANAAAGRWMERSSSPWDKTVRPSPMTKSRTETVRGPEGPRSRHVPSRVAPRAIIGPAGRAAQMLPPTVATFQILKDARNAWQQRSTIS